MKGWKFITDSGRSSSGRASALGAEDGVGSNPAVPTINPAGFVLVPGRIDRAGIRELARRYPRDRAIWSLFAPAPVLQIPLRARFDASRSLDRKRKAVIRWARAHNIALPGIQDWHIAPARTGA